MTRFEELCKDISDIEWKYALLAQQDLFRILSDYYRLTWEENLGRFKATKEKDNVSP